MLMVVEGAAMLTISRVEDVVDALLVDGRGFGEIEDFISEQPISEELKSVLWLRAWAEQPRPVRRQIIPAAAGD
jgi:hypothetical protein